MNVEDMSSLATPRREHLLCPIALNFDVLCAIMPWIKRRKDLLSYMSTCSGLYNTGVLILLGFRCAIKAKNLHPFYRFLISKSPSSFLGLRNLCCSSLDVEDDAHYLDVIDMLTDVLSRAKNLRHFEISSVRMDPALYQPLASLQSLRSLKLSTYGSYPEQQLMLTQLQSPLRNLEFDGPGVHPAVDVIAMLANFSRTLRKLAISDLTFCHNPAGPTYLKLTRLSLTSTGGPQLSILLPAFPNLQILIIKYCDILGDRKEEWRESNIQFQMDHPSLNWHLTSLTGDPESLYVLGLQTAVLDVTVIDLDPTWNLEDFEDCLETLRPMKLSICNEGGEPITDVDWLSDAIALDCNELVRFDLTFGFLPNVDSVSQYQACLVSFVCSS